MVKSKKYTTEHYEKLMVHFKNLADIEYDKDVKKYYKSKFYYYRKMSDPKYREEKRQYNRDYINGLVGF
jgi:hypothetical protein